SDKPNKDLYNMSGQQSKSYKDPLKIIDTIDASIKSLIEQCKTKATPEQVLQLNEITKTIKRLQDSKASVPDELRKLKIELSAIVTEHNNALHLLRSIEIRLAHTITDLRAKIKYLVDHNHDNSKRRKRYVKRTSPMLLRKEICKALRELGGVGKKSEVIEKIRSNMDGKFKPDDMKRDSVGVLNWEKWVVSEHSRMIKEGVLTTGLNNRLWELRRK
ncbi:MAG TPA: hypothetical protein PKM17_11835, partial [Syntrophorhabdus sp.]|nr:hypothetical protein [Syntrophorhabdus sp.]